MIATKRRLIRFAAGLGLVGGLLTGVPAGGAVAVDGTAAHPPGGRSRPGAVVAVEPLPSELALAGAHRALRIRYRSTSWSGRPTVVSGTVTVPTGRVPRGGWPVVSFGHGLSGIADACAPSRTGPSPWERAVQEALLDAGYVVAVSDYEGIGTPGPASIGHGVATAEAMIDIVRAARRLAPASREWAAVGYSLGGQAALFTGPVAPRYAPELREQGIVGMASVTQWELLTTGGSGAGLPVVPSAAFSLSSWEHTYGGAGFHATDWTTPRGQAAVERADEICIDEMVGELAGVTNADFYRDPAAMTAKQVELMRDQEIPVADYGIPVRLAHGTQDQIPAVVSQITAGQLAAAGTDAVFLPVEGADHLTLQPMIANQVVAWVDDAFRPS